MRTFSLFLGFGCIALLICGSALAADRGIGEVSGFAGLVSAYDAYTGNHFNVGGTVGANAGRFVHLFGEVNYMPIGSWSSGSYNYDSKITNFGGGIQIRIPVHDKIEPYGLITFGLAQFRDKYTYTSYNYSGYTYTSQTETDTSIETNGYFGLGGGARIFIGKKWGVKPEVRYQSYFGNLNSDTYNFTDRGHVITVTGGIFFQFGGN